MRTSYIQLTLGGFIVALAGATTPACGGGSETTASTSTGGDACGTGTVLCGSACTVTAIDPNNCGACGNVCKSGESCESGSCVLSCNGGSTKCGDRCVDTQSDPMNCGMCGKACDAAQEVCSAGQCAKECGTNLTRCGQSCVDPMTDAMNCGMCGKACTGTDTCMAGQCTTPVPPKGVYTMTNDPSGNQILSFARAADGSLSPKGTLTPTGGKGTGGGLGNQHGLIFDSAKNLFFAVNAGDNSVSMLSLSLDGALDLVTKVDSGGVRPISVTVNGNVLYVLNAGMAGTADANITGFKIMGKNLMPIASSTKPLSAANPNPAQIQFSPDGKVLVVTEKGTNALDSYTVANDVASGPMTIPSAGQTPFGFDFSAMGQVVVSEAWGGQMGMSSTSSYAIDANGMLKAVSPAVASTRTSACWLVVAGDYAYVANAMTNDITGYKVAAGGTLMLLDANGVTGQAGKAPVDEDVTDAADFLYVVNNGDHSFSIFQINAADGSLMKKPDFVGLPSTVSGIVAR